jgi:hypothetical protein
VGDVDAASAVNRATESCVASPCILFESQPPKAYVVSSSRAGFNQTMQSTGLHPLTFLTKFSQFLMELFEPLNDIGQYIQELAEIELSMQKAYDTEPDAHAFVHLIWRIGREIEKVGKL